MAHKCLRCGSKTHQVKDCTAPKRENPNPNPSGKDATKSGEKGKKGGKKSSGKDSKSKRRGRSRSEQPNSSVAQSSEPTPQPEASVADMTGVEESPSKSCVKKVAFDLTGVDDAIPNSRVKKVALAVSVSADTCGGEGFDSQFALIDSGATYEVLCIATRFLVDEFRSKSSFQY
eukprot:4332263-Amphidinium_carterae.1